MGRSSVWRIDKDPARARNGMVASENRAATLAGLRILRGGGNAVDAAVASAFALGVVEPAACGLGGGGVMLIDGPGRAAPAAIDFAMSAPGAAAGAFDLLDGVGASRFGWRKVRGDANVLGLTSAATPGFVAGLALALRRFGTMSFAEVVAPAVRLAERGIETSWTNTLRISAKLRAFSAYPEALATFAPGGVPLNPRGAYSPPDRLVQAALGRTLRALATDGPDSFYRGDVAVAIHRGMRDGGGLVTADDLAAYEPLLFDAADGIRFADSQVFAVPGSNGGFTAQQTLASLDALGVERLRGSQLDRLHLIAEASGQSFARRRSWSRSRVGSPAESTTHLVVIDRDRMAVSLTATLADNFGSGAMVPGTGIVFNNAMQWFNPEPGTGVSIEPGGRGLHNMTPLLVRREGGFALALGSAGGIRIIDAVTQIVVNATVMELALDRALAEPRIDNSGDVLLVDSRIPLVVVRGLRARGHRVRIVQESVAGHQFSRPIAAAIDGEMLVGAVDPLRPAVAAGY